MVSHPVWVAGLKVCGKVSKYASKRQIYEAPKVDDALCLQAGCRSRRLKVALFFVFIIRLQAWLRPNMAEYWKHFITRFNGFNAFGYNSAASGRIWMKFRSL